jgi:hypothetical protein
LGTYKAEAITQSQLKRMTTLNQVKEAKKTVVKSADAKGSQLQKKSTAMLPASDKDS